MRIQRFLYLCVATMLTIPAFSQWSVGASAGHAYNHYDYDPQYMSGLDFKGHHGWSAELTLSYQFNDWFALLVAPSYQKKGYILDGTYQQSSFSPPISFYTNLKRHDSYFIVPALTNYSLNINDYLRLSLDAGVYAGYWISSVFEYKEIESVFSYMYHESQKDRRKFEPTVDRRFECGIAGGLGIRWCLCNNFSLFIASRCYYALTPQQKDYQLKYFPSYNFTVTTQGGIMYIFEKCRK
ncbi:MAG: PorT family protein [Bacteroidales bacterium]|nr:PorT family protein [Bacteroidales bacterium]